MLDKVDTTLLFTGIMMLVLNTTSRDILHEFSDNDEEYRRNIILRRLAIFAVCFIGTRDIIHSLLLTAAFVVMATGLHQSKSLYAREGFILTTSLADRNAAALAARPAAAPPPVCPTGQSCRPPPPPPTVCPTPPPCPACPDCPTISSGGGTPSGTATPATCRAGTIESDKIFYGTRLPDVSANSAALCGTECCNNSSCSGFTFYPPAGGPAKCYLYSGTLTSGDQYWGQSSGRVIRTAATTTSNLPSSTPAQNLGFGMTAAQLAALQQQAANGSTTSIYNPS